MISQPPGTGIPDLAAVVGDDDNPEGAAGGYLAPNTDLRQRSRYPDGRHEGPTAQPETTGGTTGRRCRGRDGGV